MKGYKRLTEDDLNDLVSYRIDTNKCFSLLKTLKLMSQLDCNFGSIARGKDLYEKRDIWLRNKG